MLGVLPTSEDVVIRGAYVALLKKYHPDTFAGDKAFAETKTKEINAAYTILKDPAKRAAYDARLERSKGASKSARAARADALQSNGGDEDEDDADEVWVGEGTHAPEASASDGTFIRSSFIMAFILLAALAAIGYEVRHRRGLSFRERENPYSASTRLAGQSHPFPDKDRNDTRGDELLTRARASRVAASNDIPARFRGAWSSKPENCGADFDDTSLVIGPRRIRFADGGGPVISVATDGQTTLAVTARLKSAGRPAAYTTAQFKLSDDQTVLTDISSADNPVARYRCQRPMR